MKRKNHSAAFLAVQRAKNEGACPLYGCSGALRCSRNKSSSATWGIGRKGGRAPPSHWNPFFHPKIREGSGGGAVYRARPRCHELWNAAFRPSLHFWGKIQLDHIVSMFPTSFGPPFPPWPSSGVNASSTLAWRRPCAPPPPRCAPAAPAPAPSPTPSSPSSRASTAGSPRPSRRTSEPEIVQSFVRKLSLIDCTLFHVLSLQI